MPDILTLQIPYNQTAFVNGTFDLLHTGHLGLLRYAKDYVGERGKLVVAIDSDARIKSLKGIDRPILNEKDRKFHLQSLSFVDFVVIFHTDEDLYNIIKLSAPDVMVKGSDYIGKPIIGEDLCKRILFVNRLNEYSTTKTIQSCSNRR